MFPYVCCKSMFPCVCCKSTKQMYWKPVWFPQCCFSSQWMVYSHSWFVSWLKWEADFIHIFTNLWRESEERHRSHLLPLIFFKESLMLNLPFFRELYLGTLKFLHRMTFSFFCKAIVYDCLFAVTVLIRRTVDILTMCLLFGA